MSRRRRRKRRYKAFRWYSRQFFTRCGNEVKCEACRTNSQVKPHGPYYLIKRRSPETGDVEEIYLGKVANIEKALRRINRKYAGEQPAPDRETVLAFIGTGE